MCQIKTAELNLVTELIGTQSYHASERHVCQASQDWGGDKLLSKLSSDANITFEISCGRTKATSCVEDILRPKEPDLRLTAVKCAEYFGTRSDVSSKAVRKYFFKGALFFAKGETKR